MGLGSGIRNKPIPDPGPRVKKAPDPQHCCGRSLFADAIVDNLITATQGIYKYIGTLA
jgi:hypothetical protein